MAGKKGMVTIDSELCKGCYLCIAACPYGLIEIFDELNQFGYYPAHFTGGNDKNRECTGCATCALVCPDVAIEVYRE